jgi:conjugal transfer mating pair stabilization protein TraG
MWRTSTASDSGANDRTSADHSEGISTYKSGNDTWSFNESGVSRNGTFYRYSDLNESRQSLENSFREAKSYEESASSSDEKGYRLDKVVTDTKQNGWQISEDMSQVIASRYHAVATSEKYAGMGAPSLQNVNPSAHQAAVRREIVSDIMRDYALEGSAEGADFRRDVEGEIQPAQSHLIIPPASSAAAAKVNQGGGAMSGPKRPRHGPLPAEKSPKDARQHIGEVGHEIEEGASATQGKADKLRLNAKRNLDGP